MSAAPSAFNDSRVALPILESPAQRLRTILEERPLYINIETTNICNARCVFCAYPKMRRAKEVMSPDLFEKIVSDYVDLGGGAIGLTPIVGDVLLDPHLLERLRLLRDTPEIPHVAFTTNAIAWPRYSAQQKREILESTQVVSISLGGLDAAAYQQMFAVDRLKQVRQAIEEICDLKKQLDLPLTIDLLFRVNQPIDELMADPNMAGMRRPEIDHISAINSFGNWGGVVVKGDLPSGAHLNEVDESLEWIQRFKRNPCFAFYLAPEITTTGLVSACGCMNAEAEELVLGDVSEQHLGEIWRGPARKEFRSQFGTSALPGVCKRCSYYSDGERFLEHPGLAGFTIGDNPWTLLQNHPVDPPGQRLMDSLGRLSKGGDRRVGLYGAGNFTREALASPEFDLPSSGVVTLIDDNPELAGQRVAGLPIVLPREALDVGLDVVVLSADPVPPQLDWAANVFREAGIPVVSVDQSQEASVDT